MSQQGPVYEMLWDCRHCGARKLLGLTHRYCPECGAPQNAEFRYFPSEADKVLVTDHVYYGTDVVCRYCSSYNGRHAKHCKDCGGPLVEGGTAQTRQDQVHAIGQYSGETIRAAEQERRGEVPAPPERKKEKGPLVPILIGAGALVMLCFILALVFWKRDATFTVDGHSWHREIDIERFGPVKESAWCDQLPAGAQGVHRYQAVRSYENVQVGEDCKTRKVDQGDGTFRESTECTPRYDKKPINGDKCDYTVDRWSRARTLTTNGKSTTPEPSWPELNLAKRGCSTLGCEREGPRRETYKVVFKNAEDGDTGDCDFTQARWQSFRAGSSFNAKVGVIGAWLDCDSLAQSTR